MESSIETSPHFSAHGGFVIPAVLLVALVGVLFGAGRLMMYRYQCQLRIDRQHEIEKQDAVKSMLNWLRCNSGNTSVISYTNELKVVAASGREINVISVPTPVLFPDNVAYDALRLDNHFSVASYVGNCASLVEVNTGDTGSKCYKIGDPMDSSARTFGLGAFCSRDEYAPLLRRKTSTGRGAGGRPVTTYEDRLYFRGMTNSGEHAEVSIEMSKIGGWWNDDYGRRYEVNFDEMGSNTYQRIYLMRKATPWPLANNGVALCLEFYRGELEQDNVMQAFYFRGSVKSPVKSKTGGDVIRKWRRVDESNNGSLSSNGPKGIQLAGHYLSIFGATAENYIFSNEIGYLDEDVYRAFTENASIASSDQGDLKMVVQVESRGEVSSCTGISKIEVTPAYKFDVYLEYPIDPNRAFEEWGPSLKLATVAQPCTPDRANANPVVITYDTHGTENKGFRKDEREAERKRIGR